MAFHHESGQVSDCGLQSSELPFVYETATRLLKNSATKGKRTSLSVTYPASENAEVLRDLFESNVNKDAFLSQSFLFQRARAPPKRSTFTKHPPNELEQQSAKLHCLYGKPMLNYGRTRSSRMYPFACSKVYDIREYTNRTKWGPFMDDDTDRVDWEKM